MMLVMIGIITVVTFQVLYILTDIWEFNIGQAIGMFITLIGVIKFGIDMGWIAKPFKIGDKE